ncbi:hypothetical protein Salat_2955000 [Sesamum alatum]|uniref:Uncharacterized protein n=1 Tax=Sesamum alatum TaxID=300844 RepID=A0AAE1XJP9_9LAMI|nr:hypothetical protein Salat_2955000 [Sesamum alatum]
MSSFAPLRPSLLSPLCVQAPPLYTFGCYPKTLVRPSPSLAFQITSPNPSCGHRLSMTAAVPSSQESVVHFEDFVEKDWSFLDPDEVNNDGEHMQKIDQIISAGNIKETSKVLVSIGSEAFVDRVVDSSPCEQLLVVHDSLFILACIKEKYDKVKCWQGKLINAPEKWTHFDVVFLYFLPALPFELDQVLAVLASRCLPGARLVISHPGGRQILEEQQQQYSDIVVSDLPEQMTLKSTAANHSFEVVEFVDEPGFYLAVLRLGAESEK